MLVVTIACWHDVLCCVLHLFVLVLQTSITCSAFTSSTTQCVVRVLDCFFFKGVCVLYQVGLAIFRLSENRILSTSEHDGGIILQHMRECLEGPEVDMLFKVAFKDFAGVTGDRIKELRYIYKLQVVVTMETHLVKDKEWAVGEQQRRRLRAKSTSDASTAPPAAAAGANDEKAATVKQAEPNKKAEEFVDIALDDSDDENKKAGIIADKPMRSHSFIIDDDDDDDEDEEDSPEDEQATRDEGRDGGVMTGDGGTDDNNNDEQKQKGEEEKGTQQSPDGSGTTAATSQPKSLTNSDAAWSFGSFIPSINVTSSFKDITREGKGEDSGNPTHKKKRVRTRRTTHNPPTTPNDDDEHAAGYVAPSGVIASSSSSSSDIPHHHADVDEDNNSGDGETRHLLGGGDKLIHKEYKPSPQLKKHMSEGVTLAFGKGPAAGPTVTSSGLSMSGMVVTETEQHHHSRRRTWLRLSLQDYEAMKNSGEFVNAPPRLRARQTTTSN